jgi:hypothetical protein
MGPTPLLWFLPVPNSLGTGLSFPVREDVRGMLSGLTRGEEEVVEEDEDMERVYRRNGDGNWMMHD